MSKDEPGLATRVVVVADADSTRGAGIARAMAAFDAAIVLAGADIDALAALAAELGATGARVAVLVDDVATDTGRDALREMVTELFPLAKS